METALPDPALSSTAPIQHGLSTTLSSHHTVPSHPLSSRSAREHGQCTTGWAKASKTQLTSHLSLLNTWAQDQHVMSTHIHVPAPFFPYGARAENKPPHFSKKGTKSNLELSRLVATYSSS